MFSQTNNAAETNCGIAHILGIPLMNSYDTLIYFLTTIIICSLPTLNVFTPLKIILEYILAQDEADQYYLAKFYEQTSFLSLERVLESILAEDEADIT